MPEQEHCEHASLMSSPITSKVPCPVGRIRCGENRYCSGKFRFLSLWVLVTRLLAFQGPCVVNASVNIYTELLIIKAFLFSVRQSPNAGPAAAASNTNTREAGAEKGAVLRCRPPGRWGAHVPKPISPSQCWQRCL